MKTYDANVYFGNFIGTIFIGILLVSLLKITLWISGSQLVNEIRGPNGIISGLCVPEYSDSLIRYSLLASGRGNC